MYCSNCGKENPDDAKFCRECSKNLVKDNHRLWIFIAVGMAVLAIIIILIILVKGGNNNENLSARNLNDSINKQSTNQQKDTSGIKPNDTTEVNHNKSVKKESLIRPSENTKIKKAEPLTGFFTDERDGKKYKWVKIGEQVWMAENLAFKTDEGCMAFDNDESYVSSYGYLYSREKAQKIAMPGWHLPSFEEYSQLIDYLNCSDSEELYEKVKLGGSSGFNVICSGKYSPPDFYGLEKYGNYWIAGETGKVFRHFYFSSQKKVASIPFAAGQPDDYYSIRLIKD